MLLTLLVFFKLYCNTLPKRPYQDCDRESFESKFGNQNFVDRNTTKT